MHFEALMASWNQWLKSSDELLQVLHEQTAAITLRNAEKVEALDPEINHFLAELTALDHQASSHANALAVECKLADSLIGWKGCMPKDQALDLLALANQVKVAARTLDTLIAKNAALAERVKNEPIVVIKRTRRRRIAYSEPVAA